MGKITKVWSVRGLGDVFREVDSQFEALRQEIQDLKADIRDGSAFTLEYKEPKPPAPLPPEQWKRGDVLSYINYRTKRREVGIFHHMENFACGITGDVIGYWPDENGMISSVVDYRGLNTDKVKFGFRPEK